MTQGFKAIETLYAGCKFRSRLEARWAVFFDALGIQWQYEPEGMEIGWGDRLWRYLPDFWLPHLKTYVEVKGSDEQMNADYRLMIGMAIEYQNTPLADGLLLLGPVPDVTQASAVLHTQLLWNTGVESRGVTFCGTVDYPMLRAVGHSPLLADPMGDGCQGEDGIPEAATVNPLVIQISMPNLHRHWILNSHLKDAYVAARSARFEHGERPILPAAVR